MFSRHNQEQAHEDDHYARKESQCEKPSFAGHISTDIYVFVRYFKMEFVVRHCFRKYHIVSKWRHMLAFCRLDQIKDSRQRLIQTN